MTRQVSRLSVGTKLSYGNYFAIHGNAGIAGATLTYGTGLTALSDAGGDYIIIVPKGWSGTITPTITAAGKVSEVYGGTFNVTADGVWAVE